MHVSSVVSLAGVQAISPALPLVQEAFGISEAQVALVVSAYLLPSVVLAVPAGFLSDRFGRRSVFVTALVVFGLAGGFMAAAPSFGALLALRVLQGAAFAAILPLSITLLGDLVGGIDQVREQGVRAVSVAAGDTLLPLLGGALAALGWGAPFAVPLLALPLAFLAWRWLDESTSQRRRPPTVRALLEVCRSRSGLAVQAAGFLRFLFKFGVLTFVPLLLHQRDHSTWFIAAVLAGSAVAAAAAAATVAKALRVVSASTLLVAGLVVFAATFVVIPATSSAIVTATMLVAFGVAEGCFAVISNAMLLEAVDPAQRATFVAAAGAVKNLGKFLAPASLSALLLVTSLHGAFVVMGIAAVAATVMVLPLRWMDDRLAPRPQDAVADAVSGSTHEGVS